MSAEGTQSVRGTKLCPILQNLEIKGQYNDFHGFGLSGAAVFMVLGFPGRPRTSN